MAKLHEKFGEFTLTAEVPDDLLEHVRIRLDVDFHQIGKPPGTPADVRRAIAALGGHNVFMRPDSSSVGAYLHSKRPRSSATVDFSITLSPRETRPTPPNPLVAELCDEWDAAKQKRVIAGPAGHWYALLDGELLGLPMHQDDTTPPPHPSDDPEGWCEITDPAPGTDVAALTATLGRKED